MPIRILVTLLAILATLCFFDSHFSIALNSYQRAITTTPDFGLRRANYRVVTTGTAQSTTNPSRPQDYYRFIVRGIQAQDGDCISFSLIGPDGQVDLGSEDTGGENGCLKLLRGHAKGPLNSAPYLFPKARVFYRRQGKQLVFSSGAGRSQLAVALAPEGLSTESLTVSVHIFRPGESVQDFNFTGDFRILNSIRRRTDERVYRGSAQ